VGSKIRQVNSPINQYPSQQPKGFGQLSITAEKALSIYLDELNAQLNDMLSNADDHFFDKSGKSDDSRHFIALRTIRVKKDGLLNRFKQEMVNHFRTDIGEFDESLFEISAEVESLSFESLALVEDEDLEEQIAVDTMVSRARKENGEALENIRLRLEVIMPTTVITEDINPFDPSFVATAFSVAIKPIQLDVEFRLVLFKYFERNVIHELELVYQDINNFFIEQGILPELVLAKITRQSISARRIQRVEEEAKSDKTTSENQEILAVLSELLANKRGDIESGVPQQVDTDELVKALSNIQIALPDNELASDMSNVISLQDVRKQISTHLPSNVVGQLNNGALGQFNDDMIDVVTMLFDFILDDDNLKPEVKAIISRLQIPILKVGLVDKSFFSDRKHSARLLLNELAHAGLTWDPSDPSSKAMFDKIQNTVESVCSDFSDDTQLFDKLLESFVAFKHAHQKRSTIFEKRTREAEEGKARAEGAKGKVNKELQKICYKKHVPEVVQQLLKQVWVHVMFLEGLKGEEEAWSTVCKLARMLVWSVQPVKEQVRLDKLIKTVPVLIKNLKLGFNKISFSQIESSGFLDRLEDVHRQVINDAKEFIEEDSKDTIIRLKPVMPFVETESAIEEQETPEEEIPVVDIEEIAFSKEEIGQTNSNSQSEIRVTEASKAAVESLHAGSWLELKIGDEFKRCKLAAKIVSSGKFIFVNRSGVKVAEYLTDELAAEYQVGNLQILDDEALFDRALESVISNLRTMKTAAE